MAEQLIRDIRDSTGDNANLRDSVGPQKPENPDAGGGFTKPLGIDFRIVGNEDQSR